MHNFQNSFNRINTDNRNQHRFERNQHRFERNNVINFNDKNYQRLDNYLSDNYVVEEDFFDICLDKIGKGLKYIGSKALEYLKKKYMIGKYSSNYKKRLTALNRAKPIYKDVVNLYRYILTDNIENKKIVYKYIMLCNKLNKILSVFSQELPMLNFKLPDNAITNFEEVSDYINMLNNRKRINHV